MYEKEPDEAELSLYGLTRDDLGGGIEVLPENWTAVQVFNVLGTQWRVGGLGATGLDYAAIPAVLRLREVPRAEWPDAFECIRVMESEAMKVMREQRAE